ncbi:MAG TPA: polymer-forming cytoskeletal protein, partial [Thermodesulfobacteriota bacterium]
GTIVGDIVARSRIEMHAPARVVGNITTPVLVVDEGSVFDGQCQMERAREADASRGASRPSDAALPSVEEAPTRLDA